jgi:type III secretory pathway component EscU
VVAMVAAVVVVVAVVLMVVVAAVVMVVVAAVRFASSKVQPVQKKLYQLFLLTAIFNPVKDIPFQSITHSMHVFIRNCHCAAIFWQNTLTICSFT